MTVKFSRAHWLILFRHHCHRDPMTLQHACAHQCLLLRAVSKKQKILAELDLHFLLYPSFKLFSLRAKKGNFDSIMALSPQSKTELTWWVNHVLTASKPIRHGNPDLTLTTDASNVGWGAVCGDTSTGGFWSLEEQIYHINFFELKAVLLGLKSLCDAFSEKHILVQSDNTTTVAYINAMGGIKSIPCNEMAIMIWDWCRNHNIWLSATHIPGSKNI